MNPFKFRPPHQGAAPDPRQISAVIEAALQSAGLGNRNGPMSGVLDTIERSFAAAGLRAATGPSGHGSHTDDATVIDVEAHDVTRAAPLPAPGGAQTDAQAGAPVDAAGDVATPSGAGRFTTGRFQHPAGARAYRLYVPASVKADPATPRPLLLMLHGCTQTPEDFAAGTRMNALADEHGFLVLYPAQTTRANGSRCWNWFDPKHQQRDRGEPALLAALTREIAASHAVDPQRIFVAGLSAGAAMALTLGAQFPELFAAVGAHSGLPVDGASDVASALALMRGASGAGLRADAPAPRRVIVFHGSADQTVVSGNGDAIVAQALSRHQRDGGTPLRRVERTGPRGGSRSARCHAWVDGNDQPMVEHWTIDQAGHAWAGGSAAGSFTDPQGPDASVQMLRFFGIR